MAIIKHQHRRKITCIMYTPQKYKEKSEPQTNKSLPLCDQKISSAHTLCIQKRKDAIFQTP